MSWWGRRAAAGTTERLEVRRQARRAFIEPVGEQGDRLARLAEIAGEHVHDLAAGGQIIFT